MDACANFLSKGVIHLLLTVVLFYRFTAWRLLNRSISRAIGTGSIIHNFKVFIIYSYNIVLNLSTDEEDPDD